MVCDFMLNARQHHSLLHGAHPLSPFYVKFSITKRKSGGKKRKQKGSMKESLLYVKLHILSSILISFPSDIIIPNSFTVPLAINTLNKHLSATNYRLAWWWCRGSWNWLAFIVLVTMIDYVSMNISIYLILINPMWYFADLKLEKRTSFQLT